MSILSTAVAVHLGTRGTRKAIQANGRMTSKRYNQVHAALTPFVAWFDALSDQDAHAHASHVLGASKGSRFADREALISRRIQTTF